MKISTWVFSKILKRADYSYYANIYMYFPLQIYTLETPVPQELSFKHVFSFKNVGSQDPTPESWASNMYFPLKMLALKTPTPWELSFRHFFPFKKFGS